MNDPITVTRLLTRKNALGETRLDTMPMPMPLHEGEVVLQVERVAITTNNITYAGFGDAMRYWDFFPTGETGWGHMPAWGFGNVVVSNAEGIEVGERFYGYFPIASHIRMKAGRVKRRGFYDVSEHRLNLTSAYNHYTRCSEDPAYLPDHENFQAVIRPLFITSFMCADFLQDNKFFGAAQVIISSASSKTAFGTAFCLKDKYDVKLVGLTSGGNRAFVERLGCYDETAVYGEVGAMPASRPTLYLDFSGNDGLRSAIHHHFGSKLTYDCYAGSAHNTTFLDEKNLPGPKPQFYFAPVQIRKRNEDWGYDVVNQRFNEAQLSFIRRVSDPADPWMRIQVSQGCEKAQQVIADIHAGRIDPEKAHIVLL